MDSYTFLLNFRLPDPKGNPEQYLDVLFEAGCDDASVGVGRVGTIGFDFTRDAVSAEEALRTAIADVRRAIPGATLIQAGPDLIGLTEIADIFGCSRQNIRKYAVGDARSSADEFPDPVITNDPSLWHLAEIARWLKENTSLKQPSHQTIAVSVAAARVNVDIQAERVKRLEEFA